MYVLVVLGASLPFLLAELPPSFAVFLYVALGLALVYETMQPAGSEMYETLAGPTKIVALSLIVGGAVGLLLSYNEPVRWSASLLLFSGIYLFFGYRRGRRNSPWVLTGPALAVTVLLLIFGAADVSWSEPFLSSGWMVVTALLPAALTWSLLVASRNQSVSLWFLSGVAYIFLLFVFADWMALSAFCLVLLLGLWAVRQDPDVPFVFNGAGLLVWLILCFFGLLPLVSRTGWLPFSLRSAGASFLLSVQSGFESILGPNVWLRLWSIPREIPRVELGKGAWWMNLVQAQQVTLGWLGFLVAVVLIAVLFLVSIASRRSRDLSHPTLWRVLGVGAWLAVGFLTPFWLISPVCWFLLGGILALKEATPTEEREIRPDDQFSMLSAYLPAIMAALLVIPIVQLSREWRAESLHEEHDRPVHAAKWAPWRADIVESALGKQLGQPIEQRDSAMIDYLLSLLKQSSRRGSAYRAESSLNSAGGSPALVSLGWAVRSSPHDLKTRREYADALRASGLLEQARQQYEICADLAPLDPSLRIAIASLWELLRDEEMALIEYRKALTLDPSSDIARLKVKELSDRAAL